MQFDRSRIKHNKSIMLGNVYEVFTCIDFISILHNYYQNYFFIHESFILVKC